MASLRHACRRLSLDRGSGYSLLPLPTSATAAAAATACCCCFCSYSHSYCSCSGQLATVSGFAELSRKGPWNTLERSRLLHSARGSLGSQTPKPETLLGGSWVVISEVISRITMVITHIRGLIAPLITTHEPPSSLRTLGPRRYLSFPVPKAPCTHIVYT